MSHFPRIALISACAAALAACTTTYTGPVEVTSFAADTRDAVTPGPIALEFPEEMSNQRARFAFEQAVAEELRNQGYEIAMEAAADTQIATIRTSRSALSQGSSRGPVNVGVGGSTGSYGSGLGVGIGINLGGGDNGPRVMSELSVRITDTQGRVRWEGRAQQPVSLKSPYADVDASARALAAALFRDFPNGNGETITIDVDELTE
ncbi:MAG: hypothetical protein CL955_06030 [Erythrobacteraceae bacterium]|nr:hypothetical protein [Erythrobacteraceae bacterium]